MGLKLGLRRTGVADGGGVGIGVKIRAGNSWG